jgi:hypothetical protein
MVKLGTGISERQVSRLMPRAPRKPPSQTWRTFLTNHVGTLSSIDFFTVPTATFRVLYVFVVLAHDRRRVLHFNVAEYPTAAWTAQQIVEAFPEASAPKYLMRDRDRMSLSKDAPASRAVMSPEIGEGRDTRGRWLAPPIRASGRLTSASAEAAFVAGAKSRLLRVRRCPAQLRYLFPAEQRRPALPWIGEESQDRGRLATSVGFWRTTPAAAAGRRSVIGGGSPRAS